MPECGKGGAGSAFLAGGMIVVLSHLRFAAGVCVLAAGLLMGAGGAVAVADPGSSDSAAHADQQSTDAKKPKDEKKPKDQPSGTNTTDGTKDDSDLGAAVSDPVAATPNEVAPVSVAVTPVSDPTAAGPNAVAPVTVALTPAADPVAAVPNNVAPVSDAGTPVPNVVGPNLNVSALVPDMLTSVAGAGVPLTQLQSDLYSFLLGIAGVAPISDVSALVQDMLTSVAEAVVLLAQLPSDLLSFLLGIAGVPPVVGEVAGIHGPGLSAAAGASLASRLPLGLPLAGISRPPLAAVSGLPVTGSAATGVAPLDVLALARASAVSGMAPRAPDAASPIGAGSSFRHVFSDILLPVSLWTLAVGALPGAGGFVIITLAGVRVGYRQAKAGVALRAAGIAFFARPGAVPLGVVRSGSLVAIRPRALRVVRPGPLSAEHLLDKVA